MRRVSLVHFFCVFQHFYHHDANAACRYEMASELIAKLYPPNTPVELHSLSSVKLNGLTGRCGRYDSAKGWCSVTLTDTARKVAVKPANLRLLYPPGTRVELHSLTSLSALNGRVGRCDRFDPAKGRYAVVLDGAASSVKKKVESLKVELSAGLAGAGEWNCPTYTFLNRDASDRCEICSAAKSNPLVRVLSLNQLAWLRLFAAHLHTCLLIHSCAHPLTRSFSQSCRWWCFIPTCNKHICRPPGREWRPRAVRASGIAPCALSLIATRLIFAQCVQQRNQTRWCVCCL